MALLARIDDNSLSPEGRERLRYYRDYDEFTAQFFQAHAAFERAQELYTGGEMDKARAAIDAINARRVIGQYITAATHGGMTRGEQALIISLNLRWRPYLASLRQALGLEPARFKFQPTQHEPLAQGAGRNSFWIDASGALWKGLGEQETGAPAVTEAGGDEMCTSGLRIDKPVTLRLAATMGDPLAAGRYHVKVIAPAERTPGVQTRGAREDPPANGADTSVQVRGGAISITLEPQAKGALVCGIEIAMDRTH